jgi:hypothetical protein
MNDIIHGQDSSRASIVSSLLKGSLAAPRPLALGFLSALQSPAKLHPPRLSAKSSLAALACSRFSLPIDQSSHTATYGYSNVGQAGDSGNHRQCDRVPTTSCCIRQQGRPQSRATRAPTSDRDCLDYISYPTPSTSQSVGRLLAYSTVMHEV